MFAAPRLIFLAAFGALIFLVGCWPATGGPLIGAGCNLALGAALLLDYLLARRRSDTITAHRALPEPLSLGAPNMVSLRVRNRGASTPLSLAPPRAQSRGGRAAARVIVKDQPPPEFTHDARATPVLLRPGEEALVRYHVTPRAKGDYRFGDIGLRLFSPLGLLIQQIMAPAARTVRVYPDLQALRRYDLLVRRGRLQEAGLRAARYRGRGTEFESLRPYLPDDDSRHINWKATARRRQVISSQFEAERRQNLLLVLDAGRMMAGRLGEMTKLDYAINTALMCSYVAATMGDRVGLLAFAREVRAYLPPRPGRRQVFQVLEQLYRLEPELVEPDYDAAFHYLALHQRRRSLLLIFTDLVDPDSSEALLQHIGALHPHHLVICVTLADPELLGLAHLLPENREQVYQKAVALQVLADREAALAYLRRRGVHLVDAPADQLTTQTINRYLELKSRSLV